MECEFYLRSWWPSVDGRWPILQQDEDTRVLILGSESCVDLPLWGSGRTAQRTHQEIKLGSSPRAAEFVMAESQARIRKPRSILAEVQCLTETDPPILLTNLGCVYDTGQVQHIVGRGQG